MRLNGKLAIITGAGSGNEREAALFIAKKVTNLGRLLGIAHATLYSTPLESPLL